MTLINIDIPTPPTIDQLQSTAKFIILSRLNRLYTLMLETYNQSFNDIWNNDKLTPQQVLDSFGTNAAELFRLAGILSTAVNSATPNTLTNSPPSSININEDGTVTIS